MSRNDFQRVCKLLLKRRLDFRYDHIIFPRKRLRSRQILNALWSRLEGRLRVRKPLSYPFALQIEPTTHCQLNCSLCPRLRAISRNGPGHMEWYQYEKLLREVGPYLIVIALWQWGEPLLHPRIIDMVRLAHEYGVLTLISTNGQIDPEQFELEALIRAGLDMLIISVDGATQSVYERFRTDGSVRNVRRFTEAIVRTKQGLRRQNPLINVRMVATSGNEMEVEQIRSFARETGADIFSIKSISLYYDPDPASPHLPEKVKYRSFQYQGVREAAEYRRMPNLCLKPWQWPTLRYDGTLCACECDHDMQHVLGNVFTAPSFREVWRGKKAQEIRRHFPSDGRADLDFCIRCRYKLDDAIREVDPLTDSSGMSARLIGETIEPTAG